MKLEWSQFWLLPLTLTVIAACGPAALPPPEAPRPGVPQQELALLKEQYALDESECTRTAEEAVDMQRRCSTTRWADCVYAATMYWRGCGVARDPIRAEALYQRGCDFGSMLGCAMAGRVTENLDRKVVLLEEPCARGYQTACGNLGAALALRGNDAEAARAAELLEKACRDELKFCGALGEIVIKAKLQSRFAGTQTLLDRGCNEHDLGSCYVLGMALEDGSLGTVDYDRAAAVNWATCHDLSHLPSCNSLGYMLVHGRGCKQNQGKGAWYFYEACSRGYGPSCDSMGEATEKGWGGPASPAKALPFYDRGCKLGSEHACQRAKELRAAGSGIGEPMGG
jgi:TPR repeat protein